MSGGLIDRHYWMIPIHRRHIAVFTLRARHAALGRRLFTGEAAPDRIIALVNGR